MISLAYENPNPPAAHEVDGWCAGILCRSLPNSIPGINRFHDADELRQIVTRMADFYGTRPCDFRIVMH